MFKSMIELWAYLVAVCALKTNYVAGKFGQLIADKFCYDCVCLIKSFAWCSGVVGGNPVYKANEVADDWIGALYDKATKKGTLDTLPKYGIWLVYLNNEHVGVYNAQTGTVIECCGGKTCKVVERPLNFYDSTEYKWNKWSNLYWCSEVAEIVNSSPTEDYTTNTVPNRFKVKVNGVQKGAYTSYNNAKKNADGLGGVIIDGSNGKQIYPVVAPTSAPVTAATHKVGIVAGRKVLLNNVPAYNSESGPTIGNRTGFYYIWSSEVVKGKVRMTNSSTRIGKAGQVSFFVDANSLN